jgi:hypothetical protein
LFKTNFYSLIMIDIVISLLLSAVYSVFGGIFSVNTFQSVVYFASSVISSEHAAVAVVPTALLGVGAVVSLVTGNTRRFHPRQRQVQNNNGGKFFWLCLSIAFCIILRWPMTSILTVIFGIVQAYLGWIPISGPSWKILVQATMTWILSAMVAHHTTKAFKFVYRKVIRTIGTAVMRLVVGFVRIIYSTVTWLLRRVLGRIYPARFDQGNKNRVEEAEVEYQVDHEVAATNVHQVNHDMDDYVYDSDYDHEGDDEGEEDIEYDSNHYEPDDDSLTAPTNKAEESSLEDGHLEESPLMQARLLFEEVPENGTSHVSPYDSLMSDQAFILRYSPLIRGTTACAATNQ